MKQSKRHFLMYFVFLVRNFKDDLNSKRFIACTLHCQSQVQKTPVGHCYGLILLWIGNIVSLIEYCSSKAQFFRESSKSPISAVLQINHLRYIRVYLFKEV